MALDDRALLLQREMFFRVTGLTKPPIAVARALAQAASDLYFEPGATLFQRGDEPDGIYFIVEGEVMLEAPDEEPWHFDTGSVVGVLDVNLERPRARTATAQTHVHAMFVQGEDFLEVLEDNFDYAIGSRGAVAGDLHKFVIELAPSGGFEDPPPQDELDVLPEMNAVARLVVLRSLPLFFRASVQALASVAGVAESIELEPSQVLFEAGGSVGFIYVVAWGIIEITRALDPVVHARFGPSQLVGGAGTFGGKLSEYGARATTRATVLRIALADLDDVAEDHYDLTRSVIQGLAIEREKLMILRARARPSLELAAYAPAKPSGG